MARATRSTLALFTASRVSNLDVEGLMRRLTAGDGYPARFEHVYVMFLSDGHDLCFC